MDKNEETYKSELMHEVGLSVKSVGKIDNVLTVGGIRSLYLLDLFLSAVKNDDEPMAYFEFKIKDYSLLDAITQLVATVKKEHEKHDIVIAPWFVVVNEKEAWFYKHEAFADIMGNHDINWSAITPSKHDSEEFLKLRKLVEEADVFKKIDMTGATHTEWINFIKNVIGDPNNSYKTSIHQGNVKSVFNEWDRTFDTKIKVFERQHMEYVNSHNVYKHDMFLSMLGSAFGFSNGYDVCDYDKDGKISIVVSHVDGNKHMSQKMPFIPFQSNADFFTGNYNLDEATYRGICDRKDNLFDKTKRSAIGAFYTQSKVVKYAQSVIDSVLGADWQEKYNIVDCSAGTGSLESIATEPRNWRVSTLQESEVSVIRDKVNNNELNVCLSNIRQMDFLKEEIKEIRKWIYKGVDEESEKVAFFNNPPYSNNIHTDSVTTQELEYFSSRIGKKGADELTSLFFVKMKESCPKAINIFFCKYKMFTSSDFEELRKKYFGKVLHLSFMNSKKNFDNISKDFPVAFCIMDLNKKYNPNEVSVEILDDDFKVIGKKSINAYNKSSRLSSFVSNAKDNDSIIINFLLSGVNMGSLNRSIGLSFKKWDGHINKPVSEQGFINVCLAFAIGMVFSSRKWYDDAEYVFAPDKKVLQNGTIVNDSIVFALFHTKNYSSLDEPNRYCKDNHLIPFTEDECGCEVNYKSHWLIDFFKTGDIVDIDKDNCLFPSNTHYDLKWSDEAKNVFDIARKIYMKYHATRRYEKDYNPNATYYTIRKQLDDKGLFQQMNEAMSQLEKALKERLKPYYNNELVTIDCEVKEEAKPKMEQLMLPFENL